MYSKEEDQFISCNRFILNQLQANNQLNHSNQQQNINSWRAQASFIRNALNPQKSFHHQFQVSVGTIFSQVFFFFSDLYFFTK